MKKYTNLLIGAMIGAAVGLVIHYLLGPSDSLEDPSTTDGAPYRSRLDAALDAGRQAAREREEELLESFEQAKRLS